MNKPELYIKTSDDGQMFNRHVMQNYFPFIRHSNKKTISALDIGCGPGNFTHGIILPYLEQDVFEIIGIDISPGMIDYASKNYGGKQITFKEVNVAEAVPEDFVERFDYIFSFWTLHWIQDQRKLYSNVFKMLKPNGSLLVSYVASGDFWDISQKVCKTEKYAGFISNCNYFPFHNSHNPKEELFRILQDVEFENIFCEVEAFRTGNFTAECVEDIFVTLSPYYDCIPINLRKEFVLDHVNLVNKVIDCNDEKKYFLSSRMLIAHGRKKGSQESLTK